MVDIGVVGVGHMGWLHARNVAGVPGARLSAILDVDRGRAARAAAEFGAASVPDLEQLAARCDAVVIASPTTTHHAVARGCLESGLHVFLEKPITQETEQAAELIELARGRGLVLGVGHVERFNPVFRSLGGEIEKPLFVEAHRLAPFVPRSIDVDVILDLMIHDLDLLLAVHPGEATSVDAAGVPVVTARADIANVRIAFASGAVANLTASRVSRERMRRIRFFSGRSYYSLDLLARTGEVMRLTADPAEWIARGEVPPITDLIERRRVGPFPDCNPLADQLADFVRAVSGDGTPCVGGEDGLRALQLALRTKASVHAHLRQIRGHD